MVGLELEVDAKADVSSFFDVGNASGKAAAAAAVADDVEEEEEEEEEDDEEEEDCEEEIGSALFVKEDVFFVSTGI